MKTTIAPCRNRKFSRHDRTCTPSFRTLPNISRFSTFFLSDCNRSYLTQFFRSEHYAKIENNVRNVEFSAQMPLLQPSAFRTFAEHYRTLNITALVPPSHSSIPKTGSPKKPRHFAFFAKFLLPPFPLGPISATRLPLPDPLTYLKPLSLPCFQLQFLPKICRACSRRSFPPP
jgi:hypothetical protein